MGFAGTVDRCNACDKVVHFLDLMTFDGVVYHKTCFKCTHCKGNLVMSNYSSHDGVLYCKTHFEQLFKETGNFSKNFRASKPRDNATTSTPHKFACFFSGTQDKCQVCDKPVYAVEKMTMEGEPYHIKCFRCAHGGCPLTQASYASLDGVLYCQYHYARLFLEKGTLSHVLEAAKGKKNTSEEGEEGEVEKAPEQEAEEAEKTENEDKPEETLEVEVDPSDE